MNPTRCATALTALYLALLGSALALDPPTGETAAGQLALRLTSPGGVLLDWARPGLGLSMPLPTEVLLAGALSAAILFATAWLLAHRLIWSRPATR